MYGFVLINYYTYFFHFFPGHKCFVCAPDLPKRTNHHELKNMFGSIRIPKCSHFQSSRKSEYIQNCPKETMGCITQFEGELVLHSTFFPTDIISSFLLGFGLYSSY